MQKINNIQKYTKNIVFVFFDPWTVYTLKHYSITKSILSHGFDILNFSYCKLYENHIELIYQKNHPIKESSSWHIPRQVYKLGHSCGMLLYSKNKSILSASKILKKIKGKSSPFLNKPGCIRYDFKAPNKSLSLLHTSDDFESSLKECRPFFPKLNIEECILEYFSKSKSLISNLFFEKNFKPIGQINECSFVNLILRIRLRILEIIFLNAKDLKKRDIYFFIKKYSEIDFSNISLIEEMHTYINFVKEEKEILACFIRDFYDSYNERKTDDVSWGECRIDINTLVSSLKLLNNIYIYSSLDTNDFIKKTPVFLDKWEKLLFKTTLFHFNDVLIYEKANYSRI